MFIYISSSSLPLPMKQRCSPPATEPDSIDCFCASNRDFTDCANSDGFWSICGANEKCWLTPTYCYTTWERIKKFKIGYTALYKAHMQKKWQPDLDLMLCKEHWEWSFPSTLCFAQPRKEIQLITSASLLLQIPNNSGGKKCFQLSCCIKMGYGKGIDLQISLRLSRTRFKLSPPLSVSLTSFSSFNTIWEKKDNSE